MPAMRTIGQQKIADVRCVERKICTDSHTTRKRVRWDDDDGISAMEANLSGTAPPKRIQTHDNKMDQALKNIGIPTQGELCEPTKEEISQSTRQTSEQDVGTDIRIDLGGKPDDLTPYSNNVEIEAKCRWLPFH